MIWVLLKNIGFYLPSIPADLMIKNLLVRGFTNIFVADVVHQPGLELTSVPWRPRLIGPWKTTIHGTWAKEINSLLPSIQVGTFSIAVGYQKTQM